MSIFGVSAIDVHAHYGLCTDAHPLANEFMTGDATVVLERARQAGTRLTVVSPLKAFYGPGEDDVVAANEETAQLVSRTEGLLQWVVVRPSDQRTYEQADRLLREPKCVGIKVHPELHGYPIAEHGDAIFRFAAERRAIITTHSGEKNSLPDDFLPFADAYPDATLILAHLGCGWDGDPSRQVLAAQASRHGNVFIDTSSAKNIMPGLVEWAVREVGAERLLYGTDSPLYFAPMQRARIEHAGIEERDKQNILHDNAAKLFRSKGKVV